MSITRSVLIVIFTSLGIGATFLLLSGNALGVLGVILALVAPSIFSPSSNSISANDIIIEKWHKIQPDEVQEVLNKLTYPPEPHQRGFWGKLFGFFANTFVTIIAIFFFLITYVDAEDSLWIDLVALALAIHALFFLIYGTSPSKIAENETVYNPIDLHLCALNAMFGVQQAQNNFIEFQFQPEVKLIKHFPNSQASLFKKESEVKNVNCSEYRAAISRQAGNTAAVDIRFNVIPKNKPIDLLCAMISVSKNSVRTSYFPYAYFVAVFKGTKRYFDNKLFADIDEICQRSPFSLERKMEDGNTLFIITKQAESDSPLYHTDSEDCAVLVRITNEISAIFNHLS